MAKYVWDEESKSLVEVGSDWTDAERRAPTPTEEISYGGLRATDGTDISSRRKRREYMRRHNLVDANDYAETWAKAQKERETFRRGEHTNPERREALGRIAYQYEMKRRRR